jgi:hypothetical protein
MFGDCNNYGYQKAIDGKTQALNSLAITGMSTNTNSWMRFDLGTIRGDITAVRLVAPLSTTYGPLPDNFHVYLSNGTTYTASDLCEANAGFSAVGETITVLCPEGLSGR